MVRNSIADDYYRLIKDEGRALFAGAHDAFTPKVLVDELLSSVPDINKDKTILVVISIEFVISLVYTYGVNSKNITYYSDHANKTEIAKSLGVNVVTTLDNLNMRFDVGVGNPPFGKDQKAKRWTNWEPFVNKTAAMVDTIAMVVPQSITSPCQAWRSVREHCSVINVDVDKHFSVGSTFCYFVAEPNNKISGTRIITPETEYNLDVSDLPFLPSDINDQTLALMNSLMSNPKRTWRRGELHTSNQDRFDENGKYQVFHTIAQTLRSNFEHPNKTKIRAAVSLSGYPTFVVMHNGYCSQATYWTEFDTIDEAQEFVDHCNGDDIQEMLSIFKWSGWNSTDVITRL